MQIISLFIYKKKKKNYMQFCNNEDQVQESERTYIKIKIKSNKKTKCLY